MKKKSLFSGLFCQTGEKREAFLRTGIDTAAAEDAAELFKVPLFGLAGHFDGVRGTLFRAETAEDALILFDDEFSPFAGERGTFDCRVVPGHRTIDQIAENIFEYGK